MADGVVPRGVAGAWHGDCTSQDHQPDLLNLAQLLAESFMRTTTLVFVVIVTSLVSACPDSSTAPDGGTDGAIDATVDSSSDSTPGDGSICPSGEEHYEPGCVSEGVRTIASGCYQSCGSSFTCPTGLTCQWAVVNPCVCEGGEGCCAACASEIALCVDWLPDTAPYELGSLTEECEGLTGQALLDLAMGPHTVAFTYADGSPATELTLAFTYMDGTITCQPTVRQPPGVGAPDEPAHVEVVVDATVSTADGAFDESMSGVTLTLGGFGAADVTHNFAIPLAELGGSYAPADPDLVDAIRFGGTISEAGLMGNALSDGHSAGGAMMTSPIGSWNTL